MSQITNATQSLTPRTELPGPWLEFDFPTFEIGVAEYDEGPTGCTVFHFPEGAATAIDVRGGYVGKTGDYPWNHAICLAGGSLLGLEAATGVSAELFARRGSAPPAFGLVSGAIIYDYGRRDTVIHPDMALGQAAIRAARPGVFPIGQRGAGRSAACGGVLDFARTEPAGQGGAFRQLGPVKIAVFSVVNALGVVLDRQGNVVRGNRDPQSGERLHPLPDLTNRLESGDQPTPRPSNTTLTVIVTNRKLDERELTQFARQVHSSMARAIYPFHTVLDGDVLYAVTTNEVEHDALNVAGLGMFAAELLWDAILGIWSDR